jgi:uncharacterized protein
MQKESDQKIIAALCHFSPFLGFGLLIPLGIWLWQKDQSDYLKGHSAQALMFHLLCLGITSVVATVGFGASFLTAGLGFFLFFPTFLVMCGLMSIPSIIAGLKCLKGEDYSYPISGPYADRI